MENGEVLDTKEWIIAPPLHYKTQKITREYTLNALEVSGLTWAQIKRGTIPTRVCAELTTWVEHFGVSDLAVIAFNAPFDMGWYSDLLFLSGAYDRHLQAFRPYAPPLVGPWQCALMLARKHLDLMGYRLDDVAAHFGMKRSGDMHGALEDAILAGKIYHALTAT